MQLPTSLTSRLKKGGDIELRGDRGSEFRITFEEKESGCH
jgi:hypothetical protein